MFMWLVCSTCVWSWLESGSCEPQCKESTKALGRDDPSALILLLVVQIAALGVTMSESRSTSSSICERPTTTTTTIKPGSSNMFMY